MALKNYTSKSTSTFDKIQKSLATHGAKKLMFDYSDTGLITGIAFQILIDEQPLSIKLPAKIENVAMVMYGRRLSDLDQKRQEQAYRTAWANIKDWIEAQIAMIDTEMVQIEEVFLPYLVTANGQTVFEKMKENKFLLGDGKN